MEGHDHRDCNTTLTLGLNQNERKTEIGSRVFLDLEIPCHSRLNFFEETDRERSKGEEEIDFFRDFSRKKLRLTKDQTNLLEYTFKQHSNLNTAQKEALAGKVGLKPRQVEVWFQNRRARSKLKQTVTEWQLLKKTCERLNEENCRLKKELVEATPWRYSFHFPKTVKLQRCPSCECMATRSNQP